MVRSTTSQGLAPGTWQVPALFARITKDKVFLRVTFEGRCWLFGAAALFGTGLYKGINLVTLVSYLMFFVWLLNAWNARRQVLRLASIRWVNDLVFARQPFSLHIEIDNTSARPRFGLRMEDSGEHYRLTWFTSCLAGGACVRFRKEVLVLERGWYSWQTLRVCSGYPFGLVERSRVIGPARPLLVFPCLGQVSRGRLRRFLTHAALVQGRSMQKPVRPLAAQNEFHGLREMRNGDSPRWIHWRTSARRGTLMVREFEEIPSDDFILVFEPWLPEVGERNGALEGKRSLSYARSLLETAVSLASSICWEWCRQKGDRFHLVVTSQSAPIVVSGITGFDLENRLLECLALAQGTPTTDVGSLLDRLVQTHLPAAPILLLSTRSTALDEVIAQRLHRPVVSLNVDKLHAYDFYEEPAMARPPAETWH